MMRFFYPKASIIVCVSDAVKESLQSLSLKLLTKTIRIYNPVFDDSMIKLANKENNPYSKFSGINAVAVGRLSIQKDYRTMISAVKKIVQKEPDFFLHILGDGELFSELTLLVNELELENHIIFHGYIANPYPYLMHSDLFLMSSLWEGLPNAMVEALALGTQVVSTDCIAGPNEILNQGQYGTLVPTKDIHQFSQAILSELSFERSKISLVERGRSFSVDNSAKAYIKLLRSLVE
jgi:glycosyltransferase involved in cell wall biosynthesis